MRSRKTFVAQLEKWAPIVVSIVALCFSVKASLDTLRFTRLAAKPSFGYDLSSDQDNLTMSLSNGGPGFARLEWIQVFVDGYSKQNAFEIMSALGLPRPSATRLLAGRIQIQPQGKYDLFTARVPGLTNGDVLKANRRIRVQACYCSMYSECWFFEMGGGPGARDYSEVGCPAQPKDILNAVKSP
jgi:hypothetical protein